jgi:hypothetical protein
MLKWKKGEYFEVQEVCKQNWIVSCLPPKVVQMSSFFDWLKKSTSFLFLTKNLLKWHFFDK